MTVGELIVAYVREHVGKIPNVTIRRRPQEFMDELVIQDTRGECYYFVLCLDVGQPPEELLLQLAEVAKRYRMARAYYERLGSWPLASDKA